MKEYANFRLFRVIATPDFSNVMRVSDLELKGPVELPEKPSTPVHLEQ